MRTGGLLREGQFTRGPRRRKRNAVVSGSSHAARRKWAVNSAGNRWAALRTGIFWMTRPEPSRRLDPSAILPAPGHGARAGLTARWRRHYHTERPHSALGYRPPAPEAILPAPTGGEERLQRQQLQALTVGG